MERITSLYPQYQRSSDRRQQNIPVAVERRSGKDRRSQDRVVMDKQLTKDLYEVKAQVAKLEALAPKLFSDNVTTQNPTFSSMNNFTQDQLVKESKPDMSAIARQEAQLQDKASTSFQIGILAAALAGSIAISFMGSVGAVIAVGTSLYVGARVLKALIAKETSDDENKDK
ncbi:MAG: hypothetical protein LUH05_00255 [Candidatus Gastranaerophilales bacterium]|nr:hypothetical protein [Candidatus Gastranaerophilales bacterium]